MSFVSEVSAKLTADTSEFSSGMQKAANDGGKYAGELTAKVADKVFGLRDVAHTVATALGLNLENIAEHIAGFFTGMSKEVVEAMNKAQEASDRATKLAIENMRASLTEEKKYQLALQDRDRIQRDLTAATEKMGEALALEAKYSGDAAIAAKFKKEYNEAFIKQQELGLQLQEKQAELGKQEIKVAEEKTKRQEEFVKASSDATEKTLKSQLSVLEGETKIAAMKQNIADLESFIATAKLDQKTTDVFSAALQERKNALVEEEARRKKEIADIDEKNADATVDASRKEADAKRDALPIDEQIEKLKKEIAGWDAASAYQVKNHLAATDSIRRSEELRLKLGEKIAEQKKTESKDEENFAQRQSEIQAILAKGVGALSDGDKERLTTLAGQNSILQEQIKIVNDLTKQFDNFQITISRTGSAYEDQSTAALQGSLARLKSKYNPAGDLPGASISQNNDRYSAYLNNAAVLPEIAAIEALLSRRAEIQGYDQRYGESATRFQFGDEATDKALRDLSDTSTRTATAVESLQKLFNNSPLFPRK